MASLVIAALLAALGPPDAPVRDCGTRGEVRTGPLPARAGPRDIALGPVYFTGLRSATTIPRKRLPEWIKSPLNVRAGLDVTLVVAARSRWAVSLFYDRNRFTPAVRFLACRRSEPAWAYDGVVGAVTGFPGGFYVRRPACALLELWVAGRETPLRRRVAFGRACT